MESAQKSETAGELLTDRQLREQAYHAEYAARHSRLVDQPVSFDSLRSSKVRWWNAYWWVHARLRQSLPPESRVLVIGCGFGTELIQLSCLAPEVHGFDLSPESVRIAQLRAAKFANSKTIIKVAAAESLPFPDDQYDLIVCTDILHHVDIPLALQEMSRVAKPAGLVAINEVYTHSAVERIRRSAFVEENIYPIFRKWIYGTDTPYITEDERKLDEFDMATVREFLLIGEERYFNAVTERFLNKRHQWAARLEALIMKMSLRLARICGGRVAMIGRVQKAPAPQSAD